MPFAPDLVEVLGRQSAGRLGAQAARWSKRWGIPALTELAHVAVARLFGKTPRPHGDEWRALVRAAGFTPHIHLVEPRPMSPAPGRRQPVGVGHYEHRCPVCQMVRIGRRPVPGWKCSRCVGVGLSGTLVVTRILPKK